MAKPSLSLAQQPQQLARRWCSSLPLNHQAYTANCLRSQQCQLQLSFPLPEGAHNLSTLPISSTEASLRSLQQRTQSNPLLSPLTTHTKRSCQLEQEWFNCLTPLTSQPWNGHYNASRAAYQAEAQGKQSEVHKSHQAPVQRSRGWSIFFFFFFFSFYRAVAVVVTYHCKQSLHQHHQPFFGRNAQNIPGPICRKW